MRTQSRPRTWALLTMALFVAGACWSLATPLFAGADEPAQIAKAAAVVRGEISPTTHGVHIAHTGYQATKAFTEVQVPRAFTEDNYLPLCFMFETKIPASCMGPFPTSNSDPAKIIGTTTYVGRYPPLYYALVGWPTRWFPSATGVYLVRLLSALVNAAALGLALVVAGTTGNARHSRLLTAGVMLAATPTVLFTGAVVNPNGLEASACIALWVVAIRLTAAFPESAGSQEPERPPIFLLAATLAAASVASLMRGLSPFWVTLIAVNCGLYAGRARLRALSRLRSARITAGAVVAVMAAASTWIIWAGSLDLIGTGCGNRCPSTLRNVSAAFGYTSNYLHQLVGVFGWVMLGTGSMAKDTVAPYGTFLIWGVAVVSVVLLALQSSRVPREIVALAACIAGTILVPVAIGASQTHRIGPIWQGRYVLPFAAGIPILATAILERSRPNRFAIGTLLGSLLAGEIAALWWLIRRFSVGANGPVWFPGHASWSPPVPAIVLALGTALSLAAVYWWTFRAVFRRTSPSVALSPSASSGYFN